MRHFGTRLSAVFIFFARYTHSQSTDSCFFRNGTLLPSDDINFSIFKPCGSSGPSTICCAGNRPNPPGGDEKKGDTQDECLPNGICQNRITRKGEEKTGWYANFCTDANWNSGNCLNICAETRNSNGNTGMTPCTGRADSDRWCCGGDNATCCETGIGMIRLPQKFGGSLLSSSVSSSASASQSSISSSSATASAATSGSSITPPSSAAGSASPDKNGLSGGAIAGIAIGALAGALLIASVIFFAMRANKYKKQAATSEASAQNGGQHDEYYSPSMIEKYAQGSTNTTPLFEMAEPPSELASPPSPRELSSENHFLKSEASQSSSYTGAASQIPSPR